ncbi:hypothetical protein [Cyanobium sp. N5-Cardenillas]|uniref:hypothetical protein n=1 Tax=Cyanobium sp. N5-Cardenillas TaxID=2823720 RepID=UPI0020CC0229|nr:hypothetical protein [Cyanobium sp. N5-Cardenillas]MCP9785814.1 hypothetical protein [Cyanobium sp. N5-Cardenillas]
MQDHSNKTPENRIHPEMEEAVFGSAADDQEWFRANRSALVRFRPAFPDELEAQDALNQTFSNEKRCSLLQPGETGGWIAVVELFRLLGMDAWPYEGCRMRLECPPVIEEYIPLCTELVLETVRPLLPHLFPKHFRAGGQGFG